MSEIILSPERLEDIRGYIARRWIPPQPEAVQYNAMPRADKRKPGLSFWKKASHAAPSASAPTGANAPSADLSVHGEESAIAGLESALQERLRHADETFSQALSRILREKDLTEPEVYNRVFMDRKLFSKIRNAPDYQPTKRTALLLAIGLQLNLDETRDFIGKAGFALTRSSRADIIVEYFLLHRIYDIQEIDETLYSFGEPTLNK